MTLSRSLLSGLLFIAFGAATAIVAYGYDFGTAVQMGPGYFPFLVGLVLAGIGVALVIVAVLVPDAAEEREPPVALRPLFFVLAAVVAFGALAETLGMVAAIAAMVVIARLAERGGSWRELAVMVAVLTALPLLIFVYALDLPFRLWPW